MTGDVVEALGKAGVFRLSGVLVGTVAFQTYSAHLGVRLPGAVMQTADADFAQVHSIATAVDDTMPPIVEVLQQIDPTFRPIPHMADGRQSTQYINGSNYKVEFLTPNRSSDDYTDKPAVMPSLGGTAAQPLRFLDFLVHEPVGTVMLHKAGIPVLVPATERYAVHKFIAAGRRLTDANGLGKREKDIHQARLLFEALAMTRQQALLADAFADGWNRDPHWRAAILTGMNFLRQSQRKQLDEIRREGLPEIGEGELDGYPSAQP